MGFLFIVASYAFFYHVGRLLMRLVVVQPVSDGSIVRWCFASTFASSLSLFSAVLADMAHASLFSSRSAGMAHGTFGIWVRRLQRLVEVNAREFTFLLLSLLATVLVACPIIVTLSFFRHLFQRKRSSGSRRRGGGGRSAAGAGGSGARGRRSRRSSMMSNGSGLGLGSRRSSLSGGASSTGNTGFTFDEDKRRGWCCGLRTVVLAVVVLLLLSGVFWASRTGRVDLRRPVLRVTSVGRAIYQQLRTRTTLFEVPQEIQRSGQGKPNLGEGHAAAAADVGEKGVQFTPQPGDPSGVENRLGTLKASEWAMEWTNTASAAFAPHGLLDAVRAITSRVAVLGVAMIGLLAGYAAITSPYLYLAPYVTYRGKEEELRKAQGNFTKKLCYVLNNYGNAQRQIATLQYGVLHEEWASPAFSGSAPSSNTHTVPPSFDFPSENANHHSNSNSPYDSYSYTNPVDASSPLPPPQAQPQEESTPNQFVESSPASAKQFPPPPPPRRPASSKPLDLTALANTPTPSSTGSNGAVGWLQRKLTSAATVVTSGIAGRTAESPATPSSSAMSPAVSRQRAVARIKKLREESKGARFLCLSLYLQLNEVEGMLRDAQRGSTWVGRWYAGLGLAMGLYSAVKIVLTTASLWYFKASTLDPVTRAVTLLEDAFILRRRSAAAAPSFSVTAVEVSTHVILALALVVNGWMVISAIRGALLALFHVTMSFSGSAVSRPETVAVGLSMLIGVYFIGQLVLLRSSLPGSSQWQSHAADASSSMVTGAGENGVNVLLQVLGTLPYYYYQRLNDWCFMVGCLGAVVLRRVVLRNALSTVVYTASGGEER